MWTISPTPHQSTIFVSATICLIQFLLVKSLYHFLSGCICFILFIFGDIYMPIRLCMVSVDDIVGNKGYI